ncbi:hypothetical protein AAFC00_003856 [Neodothiora populina]|uniref:HhH-GPD domain-containing protein n=1 Tax=Neodothiora populina TaxID=2781224 RepID=A0ABR3PGT7_9PEZI
MSNANHISAEQAAQAIVLLDSNHAIASDYLWGMDGDVLPRAEFKEYLKTSSREEYLDLLRGHLPDECATLARKAVRVQAKLQEKGKRLAGERIAKDIALQFFDALDLGKSQGLEFTHVQKAIKTLNLSSTSTLKDADPKSAEQKISAGSPEQSKKDEASQSAQPEANKSLSRKERRQKAFQAAQKKLQQAGGKDSNEGQTSESPQKTSKSGEDHQLADIPNKKRKHDAISVAEGDQSKDTTPARLTKRQRKSQRRREARLARESLVARDTALVDKVNGHTEETVTAETPQTADPTTPVAKKQPNGVSESEHEPVSNPLSESPSPSTPADIEEKQAVKSSEVVPASAVRKARKRHVKKKQKAKQQPQSQALLSNGEGQKPEPEESHQVLSTPAYIPPNTELRNEPDNPASTPPQASQTEKATPLPPTRTSLPKLEPKVWVRLPLQVKPLSPPLHSSLRGRKDSESSVSDEASEAGLQNGSSPALAKSPSNRAPERYSESDAESTCEDSVDSGGPPIPDSVCKAESANFTSAIQKPEHSDRNFGFSGLVNHKPIQSSPFSISRFASLTVTRNLSGRTSLGFGSISHGVSSLASLHRTPVKTTSIPTVTSNHDPRDALKNLNKFLNNGNSSDESESEDEDSDSSSDDGHVAPVRSTPSLKQISQKEPRPSENVDNAGPNNASDRLEESVVPTSKQDSSKSEHIEAGSPGEERPDSTPSTALKRTRSFEAFHKEAVQPSQEPSPSPEIPDLPKLMDQGGYVPQILDGGYTSSHASSANNISADSRHPSSEMEIDLLSPFKDPNPDQASAEGIVRPSEILEYSSSPPFKGAPSSDIEQQMQLDPVDDSSDEVGANPRSGPVDQIGSDVSTDDDEVMSETEIQSIKSNEHRNTRRRSHDSYSNIGQPSEHNTEDDQIMASSQLLGEARAGPLWPSETVVQPIPSDNHDTPLETSVARSIPEAPKLVDEGSPIDDEYSGESDASDESLTPVSARDDGAEPSEVADANDGDEDEKKDSGSEDGDMDPGNNDDATSQGSDASDHAPDSPSSVEWDVHESIGESEEEDELPAASSVQKRKATGTTPRHFPASPEKKKAKRVAGVSSVPFPKLSAPRFGIIQERLCGNPFQMLCAVLFLNKTNGRVARDTIMQVLEKWPTPEALSQADPKELLGMIEKLGLQNERTKKLIKLAEIFVDDPPRKARRHRTLHYPQPEDGKRIKDGKKTSPKQIVEEDSDEIDGFLEIGHLYGAGPYAWDSWRIFCRDVLRGVAEGYNGEGVEGYNIVGSKSQCTFEPEWKRVVPKDKELRACLRWMWLREGWDWDPLTGEKVPASVQKMRAASQGIAEWTEPVVVDPHGVEAPEKMSEQQSGPEALRPGVSQEVVVDTIEQPQQSVQDSTTEEVPAVARLTRSRAAAAITGAAASATKKPAAATQASTVQDIKQEPTSTPRPQRTTKAPESSLPTSTMPAPASRSYKKRKLQDADPDAESEHPVAKLARTGSTPQHSREKNGNNASSPALSPRSIRKLKAQYIAEYKASQSQKAIESSSSSSPLVRRKMLPPGAAAAAAAAEDMASLSPSSASGIRTATGRTRGDELADGPGVAAAAAVDAGTASAEASSDPISAASGEASGPGRVASSGGARKEMQDKPKAAVEMTPRRAGLRPRMR